MGADNPWAEKERTCLIDTANLWDATELVGIISEQIRTEQVTDVPVAAAMTERANALVKAFEQQGSPNFDDILLELDDIVLEARQGSAEGDPLDSVRSRLDRIHGKLRLRVATETINCIIGG